MTTRHIQRSGLWGFCILLAFALMVSVVPAAEGGMQGDSGIVTGKSEAGVTYMHGGVGKSERAKMDKLAKNYNLKAVCAGTNSDYLAFLDVRVTNAKGDTVLHIPRTEGPWVFAKLPAGTYTVKATYEGETKTAKATVGMGLKTLQLRWKLSGAD